MTASELMDKARKKVGNRCFAIVNLKSIGMMKRAGYFPIDDMVFNNIVVMAKKEGKVK